MKKNNKIFILAVIVIIAAGTLITGISAYFVATSSADNDVNIGNNKVTIEETFTNPDIKPNVITHIPKKVEISNNGKTYAAVRVKAEFSKDDVFKYTTVDYNDSDWTKEGDYWYYNLPLAPEKETPPLFNKLTLKNPTAEQVSDFDVYVYAESRNIEEDANLNEIIQAFSR